VADNGSAFEPVEVMLDKKRRLRFSMRALRCAEKRLTELRGEKIKIFNLLSPANQDKLGPDEIIVLFHQGLLQDDPSLTEEQVEEMIDVRALDGLAERLAEALGGPKPNTEARDSRPLARSPGSISGPSGESS
jgi:hypothetical protein